MSLQVVIVIQVFIQLGSTFGQGAGSEEAGGAGADDGIAGEDGEPLAGGGDGAKHLVQTVEVEVISIVEIVVVVCNDVVEPEVIVLVTGQVVTVVATLILMLAFSLLRTGSCSRIAAGRKLQN